MTLGGLDIGTTGCKCTVMKAGGTAQFSCYREYAVSRKTGAHEADAAVIWETVKEVIRGAHEKSGEMIDALTVTSFGESVVLLDEAGEPVAPVMLYTDPRGQEQSRRLCETIGDRKIYELSGHRPNAMYALPKLMYLRDTDPALFSRIRLILPIHSYLVYRLCGEAVSDYSLASRTMLFNIRTLDWCDELLAAGGIGRGQLPRVAPTGAVAGTVRPALANELGLSGSAKLVIGCQDQIAAVIGAGAMSAGLAVNGTGTVDCITPVFDGIPADTQAMFENGYALVPALGGLYVTYAFIFTGGASLQWFRDSFAAGVKLEAEKTGKSVYALLDSKVRPDPSGLLVLPHFAGAATPYMDTGAKGAILGLLLAHDEIDLYRAILEGVAYENRVNLERLGEAGVRISSLRATGGGSKSPVWLQIKADILNRPIATLEAAEAGTMGSLMLAGLACGVYSSLEEAMSLAKEAKRFEPAADRARYDEIFGRYRRVYGAVKSVYA